MSVRAKILAAFIVAALALVLNSQPAAQAQPADSTRVLSGGTDLLTALPTPVGGSFSGGRCADFQDHFPAG